MMVAPNVFEKTLIGTSNHSDSMAFSRLPSGWKAKNRGKLTSVLASNRQPVVLEPCLDIFEAHKPDLLDCAHVVPMVVIMSIVVAHNPENQSLLPSNAYYLPTDVENEKGVTSISLVTS